MTNLPLPTDLRLSALSGYILAGDWRTAIALDPRAGDGDVALYTAEEWQTAAQEASDGDGSDLSLYLARNAAWQEYVEDRRDTCPHAFSDYLIANRHRHPDALDWHELRLVGRA